MIEYLTKYKIFAGIIIICLIFIPILFWLLPSQTTGPEEGLLTPTLQPGEFPATQNVSPLQKAVIGKTTEEQVNKLPGLLNREVFPDGQIKYNFESPLSLRPNEIILKNGRVVYERELTPEEPSLVGYTTLSEMTQRFGNPDKVFEGSKFYGWPLKQYIYSTHGFSFVANPNNNEVYEMNFFEPMSVPEYEARYGQDITIDSGPHVEDP